MPNNIIEVPFARTEDQRQRALFAWADRVLHELGVIERIARANSLVELRRIAFDVNTAEVDLAVRDALRPAHGTQAWFLDGLRAGGLKRILKMRFDDIKADREAELRHGRQGGRQAGGQQSTSNWVDELKFDRKGNILPTLANLILFLRHHPQWQGVLAYDEFGACVVIRERPPWGVEARDTPWTDHHESQTRVWFQREDINPGLGDVGRAVQAAARHNSFHPVRDYLDGLQWDRVPRLDNWLVTYCHAEDSEYVRAIGPRWSISLVARIYEPGCKVDHVLILEGPQGQGKSEMLRELAVKEAWFSDRLSHMATKDAAMETAGLWLVEIAELDALMRPSSSTSKSFITRRYDRYRPPHGKHTIRLARQCAFGGTINPPPGGYLKDPTGARRGWPVACRGNIDLDGIKRDRDQLWAEAVHRYKLGQAWWLETPELEALATAEQALRFKVDVWTQPIKRWIGRRTDVSVNEVLQGALGIKSDKPSHPAKIRVVEILKAMGFTRCRARRGSKRENKRPNRYRRNQP